MRIARSGAVLLTVLTLAACGTASAGTGPGAGARAADPTVLSIAQATRLVYAYSATNNAVNSRYSAALDQTIEESPASVASIAGLHADQIAGKAISATQYFGPVIAVPRIAGYPRTMLAITHLRSHGTIVPYTSYLLFVQDSPNAGWRVAYYPYSTGQVPVPPPASAGDDSVPAVTSDSGLLAGPAALSAAIFAHATGQRSGTAAVPLAATPELDRQLTAGFTSGVKEYNAMGDNVYRTLLPTTFPSYLIRTKDGGVLAFTADEVRDVIVPAHSGGHVSLPQGSTEAALAGDPGGATASRFAIVRLQMFMSYIPPRSDPRNGVEVLSYSDYPINVSS